MSGEYKPIDDRELAIRVVTRNLHCRAIPGTRGQLQPLTAGELKYLRWLGTKVLAERESSSIVSVPADEAHRLDAVSSPSEPTKDDGIPF